MVKKTLKHNQCVVFIVHYRSHSEHTEPETNLKQEERQGVKMFDNDRSN